MVVVLTPYHCAVCHHQVVVVQVGTSLVMGFSSFLMYQLEDVAWYRLFIWTFIGEEPSSTLDHLLIAS